MDRYIPHKIVFDGGDVDGDLVVSSSSPLPVSFTGGGSSGTQYTEDAASAADPIGTVPLLVRKDTPAATVSADGDNIAQRGSNFGAAYVTLLDTGGNPLAVGGGTQFADGAARSTATGTLLMVDDGTLIQSVAGTSSGLLKVDLSATAVNATAIKVDGSSVTQPVSVASIPSHAVTNSGTFAVQAATTLTAETTKVIGTINVASAQSIASTQSGTWTVQPGNTANTTAWKVDGSAVTQPVSVASIPSHAVTNAGTFAVQDTVLEAAIISQGTALGTIKELMVGGSVTTAAPTYTTGQINPLSLDTTGALRVNVTAGGSGNGAVTVADGADVTLGAKADAKSTATDTTSISAMSVLKQISASVQAPPSQAVTNAGTFATQSTLSAETTKVIGTVNISSAQAITANAGTNLNTSALALDSTIAKDATIGTTNTAIGIVTETAPTTDIASSGLNGRLQRIAQRVTSLITALGSPFQAGGSIGNTTFASTQSGTWTVQPGNTANTTAWKVDGSAVTQPVSVASLPSTAVTNVGTFAVQSAATLAAETTKVIGTVNISSSQTIAAVTAITNQLPAGINILGKVGIDQTTPGTTDSVTIKSTAHTTSVTVTRPANVTQYAVNDAIGDTGGSAIMTFANMGIAGNNIYITGISIMWNSATLPTANANLTARFYNASPTAIADNAAWDLVSGDRTKWLASIPIGILIDLGSTAWVSATQLGEQVLLSTSSLFMTLTTDAAITVAENSTVFVVTVHTQEV
jgi:hypothetical protein